MRGIMHFPSIACLKRTEDDLFGAGLGGVASSRGVVGGEGGHLTYEVGELTGTVNSNCKTVWVGEFKAYECV